MTNREKKNKKTAVFFATLMSLTLAVTCAYAYFIKNMPVEKFIFGLILSAIVFPVCYIIFRPHNKD